MRHLFLVLLVGLSTMLGSLVAAGSAGGGGDTGVWILPNCRPVASTFSGMFAPRLRASLTVSPNVTAGVNMAVSSGMGAPVCSLWAMPGAVPMQLLASGSVVTLPLPSLLAVRDLGIRAEGSMVDAAGNGYLIHVVKISDGSLQIQIY